MALSADAIDGITLFLALILASASALFRHRQTKSWPTAMQFMSDALNGAVIFPLLLLITGLFWREVSELISSSNRVLVFLAYLFTLYWVMRSIFSRNT